MKHFCLVVNREKENAGRAASLIEEYLIGRGCECLRLDQDGRAKKKEVDVRYRYTDRRTVPPETECVICLGGDGTLIRAARDLAGCGLPLFGINMGHLGYLTQIGREEDILPAMEDLIAGHFRLEYRMMLRGRVFSEGRTVAEDVALNDIVLSRRGMDALRFDLFVNGQHFNEYSADGVIVATPTGSTAYNLSAGGPIAAPEAQLILLTPICAHTLNARSIVLAPDNPIRLAVGAQEKSGASLSFDGDTIVQLSPGDFIEIERSRLRTELIQLKQMPFLENIRNKMRQI